MHVIWNNTKAEYSNIPDCLTYSECKLTLCLNKLFFSYETNGWFFKHKQEITEKARKTEVKQNMCRIVVTSLGEEI